MAGGKRRAGPVPMANRACSVSREFQIGLSSGVVSRAEGETANAGLLDDDSQTGITQGCQMAGMGCGNHRAAEVVTRAATICGAAGISGRRSWRAAKKAPA